MANLGKAVEETMHKAAFAILALIITSASAVAAERPMRFWNLTRHTISEFQLAPGDVCFQEFRSVPNWPGYARW